VRLDGGAASHPHPAPPSSPPAKCSSHLRLHQVLLPIAQAICASIKSSYQLLKPSAPQRPQASIKPSMGKGVDALYPVPVYSDPSLGKGVGTQGSRCSEGVGARHRRQCLRSHVPGTLHPATGPVLEEPAVHGGRALYPVPCTVDEAAPHEELRPPRPYSESEAYPEPEVPNPHTNTTSDEPGPGPGGHTGHT